MHVLVLCQAAGVVIDGATVAVYNVMTRALLRWSMAGRARGGWIARFERASER